MTKFTHLNEAGEASMVDVSSKEVSTREATAQARLKMSSKLALSIRSGKVEKGDVFAVARIAGIQAAKRTSDLIPLCHPLPISRIDVSFSWVNDNVLCVTATCKVTGRTGVEMEALTAASIASLTVYDMCKAVDRGMSITDVELVRKSGGKSGTWERA